MHARRDVSRSSRLRSCRAAIHHLGHRMPRIGDVAILARVSASTVSQAWSGHRPVNPATRARVLKAAAALGYSPPPYRPANGTMRPATIGVMVPDVANPFYSSILQFIEHASRGHGYGTVIFQTENDAQVEEEYADLAREMGVAVLVYCPARSRPSAGILRLADAGTPVIALDEPMARPELIWPVFAADNGTGGRLAAKHLLSLGHRDIAIIGGPAGLRSTRERVDGFIEEAAAGGVTILRHRCRCAREYQLEAGFRVARELLQADPRITAVFCCSDLLAIGTLHAARAVGLALPEALSVVGFDDTFVAAAAMPPLTTIRQPLEAMCAEAVAVALRAARHRNSKAGLGRRLPVQLIVRESTAPPRQGPRR